MKATEAAALLTIAAAYDNRKPDVDQAKAWAMALDGLRFEDCRHVIVEHYQRSKEWLMPFDIITGVKRLRDRRLREAPPLDPPSWLDPDDTGALIRWRVQAETDIADGTYEAPAPAAVEAKRDVIRELGQAGNRIPADIRTAIVEGRQQRAAALAAYKRKQEEKQAAKEAAREADKRARDEKQAARQAREADGVARGTRGEVA